MLRLPTSDGLELAVHDLGPDPRGPHTLLAHATGFHGLVWQPFARFLTGRAAWAPDLRAHGDSRTPPGQELDWESFADDILATVDGLQLDHPLGVGHSKGGAALLLAEARRPGTFRSLWVYEPVVFPPGGLPLARPPGGSNPLAVGARQRRAVFDSFEAAEQNYASKPPLNVFHPDALHAYVRHGFDQQADGSVVLKCRPEDEARVYEMGARHSAWDRLDRVRCPVAVARGSLESPGPGSVAEELVERLPKGSLEVYDELGHFGPLQAPARLAGAVLDHAARPTPSSLPQ